MAEVVARECDVCRVMERSFHDWKLVFDVAVPGPKGLSVTRIEIRQWGDNAEPAGAILTREVVEVCGLTCAVKAISRLMTQVHTEIAA